MIVFIEVYIRNKIQRMKTIHLTEFKNDWSELGLALLSPFVMFFNWDLENACFFPCFPMTAKLFLGGWKVVLFVWFLTVLLFCGFAAFCMDDCSALFCMAFFCWFLDMLIWGGLRGCNFSSLGGSAMGIVVGLEQAPHFTTKEFGCLEYWSTMFCSHLPSFLVAFFRSSFLILAVLKFLFISKL